MTMTLKTLRAITLLRLQKNATSYVECEYLTQVLNVIEELMAIQCPEEYEAIKGKGNAKG